jgi:hypothetical protein
MKRSVVTFAGFMACLFGDALGQEILPRGHAQTAVAQKETSLAVTSCSAATDPVISCGATIQGQFSSDDCVNYGFTPDGRAFLGPVDNYRFAGATGQAVSVDLKFPATADVLAIYLIKSDGTGEVKSVYSGGSGWGELTLAAVLPETTTYTLAVLESGGSYGPYTMSLACNAGGFPDLAFYKPPKWSDSMVVSTATGCGDNGCTDSSSPTSSDSLYLSFAVANKGTAPATSNFKIDLYVDDVYRQRFQEDNLLPGWYATWTDYSLGRLSNGIHTLRLVADATNSVAESDETNNVFVKSLVIGGGSLPPCAIGSTNLCLSASRFKVSVNWSAPSQGTSGVGTAVTMTSDTGHFWFFSLSNVELVIKVLDGRTINGKFWVFYGALSDVQYTIIVMDTQTGMVRTYTNAQGQLASVADTSAF